MTGETILRVAVPAPLRRLFDYLPPAGSDAAPRPGLRVVVPLAGRSVVGVVMAAGKGSSVAHGRLRRALRYADTTPVLPADILALCEFAAQYYHAPIGEVVCGALPVELRGLRAPAAARERYWQATANARGLADGALARAPRQADALRLLLERGPLEDRQCRIAGIDSATVRELLRKGLVEAAPAPATPASAPAGPAPTPSPHRLNPAQAAALQELRAQRDRFACFLLEGVTGSGKTEVYLRFIAEVLDSGRQALVLVPEIGLTPQTRKRFVERFGCDVAVLHSGRSERERLQAWRQAADGSARVLIGTRSALFCPLPALGAIIVDEEHDASFKQQEGFRYSARDLAVFRARQHGIPVVLGSATPATETLANCAAGRFAHLRLPERAGRARPPEVELIDIRRDPLEGGISAPLLARIGSELQAGKQVLVFLNRRGWAPVLSCIDCGWMAGCEHCDARLTLHRGEALLWCHHCDARQRVPAACPACRSARLQALGAGTERSEHTLQQHFPGYPIRRIDRGTMQGRDAMDALAAELDRGEPCILVGTQMLAKGHHFPAVTLAALVEIDSGLFSADFRAAERTGQLIVQVAGRAGRAELPGRVLIQTAHPGHPWIRRLVDGGYRAFIEPLLEERRRHAMPPFAHLALLRAESTRLEVATQALKALRATLEAAGHGVDVIGPVPAPLQRRAGLYRMQLLLRHAVRAPLHAALAVACEELEARRPPGLERWGIDVDPLDGF